MRFTIGASGWVCWMRKLPMSVSFQCHVFPHGLAVFPGEGFFSVLLEGWRSSFPCLGSEQRKTDGACSVSEANLHTFLSSPIVSSRSLDSLSIRFVVSFLCCMIKFSFLALFILSLHIHLLPGFQKDLFSSSLHSWSLSLKIIPSLVVLVGF